MPTSEISAVPILIKLAQQIRPNSVLDIGLGFGKYGFLLREYLDVHRLQQGAFKGSLSDNFHTKIDGIEIFEKYISDVQKNIYNNIYIGSALDIVDTLGQYELILLMDVLEHFDKAEGQLLLRKLSKKANKAVILNTPAFNCQQGAMYNNLYAPLNYRKLFIGFWRLGINRG